MTPEERLEKLKGQRDEVEAAITAIQNGAQEYRIGNRSMRKPDLALLYRERDRLDKEIEAMERGGGIFRVAIFDGR